MHTKFSTTSIIMFTVLWLLSSPVLNPVKAEQHAESGQPSMASSETAKSTLKSMDVTTEKDLVKVLITADKMITMYKSDIVAKNKTFPDRMFVDIDNVNSQALPKEKIIGSDLLQKIRVAKRGDGVRIVFDSALPDLFHYDITSNEEGLLILIKNPAPNAGMAAETTPEKKESTASDSTLEALIDSSSSALETADASAGTVDEDSVIGKYDFSGYKNKRISFDFFKIDIHNVFRVLREITGLNIVVDEAVKGTLTLALDDVPWDFALDIILNLTGLEKEERYNTIVIYPKKKKFEWPKRAADNLDVQVDLEVIEKEALTVQKVASQPQEIIQAKAILRKAQNEEKQNKLEEAAELYEQALALWPANNKISNKLATLYLVGLNANAKAVNFAKESLKINPKDTKAALYAAIGMANMNRLSEAIEYFNQAISTTPPMKEALVSYATFSENNDQPEAALKLLDTYYSYYGDTVETMIARARIYDKIGETDKATDQYKAVLNSGFQLRPDLKKYINGRIAVKNLTTGME